ncbi:hypothetical protein ABENE_02800 [Asticcacaulis benevestitus DSM 16100 = ATCC BAA-896]|uniref:Uncharacterized protein n=1 Tax=Asticcacaulis benevestitus DSM 16100 = ATCC BAA-896 TaxID=1121022 RepID=V4Q2V6_9CAUL|nr:hypothetical protein ABENE_02800 [Asticcacaulis benevestitus DSM 16100 = ATCC BAA-896]
MIMTGFVVFSGFLLTRSLFLKVRSPLYIYAESDSVTLRFHAKSAGLQ